MFLCQFCKLFRRCLSVRTVEKCVNKINAVEFESNLIKKARTLCTATNINDKNYQNNQRTSDEIRDRSISKIESIFMCSTEKATEIFNALETSRTNPNLSDIVTKVRWLLRRKIQLSTILDNYKLLSKPFDDIESVYIFLKKMGWSKPDHILPFVSMSLEEIKKLETIEMNRIKIRVYWLAAELKSDPYDVSKNCAKHPFILFFNDHLKLEQKINLMKKYGMSTEDILHDLYNLALGEQNIMQRLAFLKDNGIKYCLPWMLRGRIEAIEILIHHRNTLDPVKIETLDTLARTLKLHGHTAKMLFEKHEFIQNLDAHQMSLQLQFLLGKFTADEIKQNIRMLRWTTTELDKRISDAKALGIECLKPSCLAKSTKQFQKWLKNFAKSKDRNDDDAISKDR